MRIICVLYDQVKNKVLIKKNGDEQNFLSVNCDENEDYFNVLQSDLLAELGIKVQKGELSTIFESEDHVILLLNSNSCELMNFQWVELNKLKRINDIDKRVLSRILNYFFRVGKIKMEPLYFFIRCEDTKIINECVSLIRRRNPGIAVMDKHQISDDNSMSRIIFIREYDSKMIDSVKEIKLVKDKENDIVEDKTIGIKGMSIEGIYIEVMRIVSELYQEKVIENAIFSSCYFYGVTGMTESGKSYFAKHLDVEYNMWNLKIRAFIEQAKCLVDKSIVSLLEVLSIQVMIEFSCYHYFKDSMVIESVYSERIHGLISKLLRDKYKLIFIDVNEEERKKRSLDSLQEFENKDIKKRKMGIDNLRDIAEIRLDNSKSIAYSKKQLKEKLFRKINE